ncbi:winged helix-turn-helix domain-containing protein [uncultured Methylobacterium sp.]|uniref:winged helix-turn-helix domain-containing protein n=1 Tax=uncultured Methylobacterium sp. TaxID=157278 RepID=UPI0035CA5EE3
MGLSEAEIEARLASLRRQRDALDREIADHVLYLELGRRLRGSNEAETDDRVPGAAPTSERASLAHSEATAVPAAGTPTPVAFGIDPAGSRRYGRALVEAARAVLARAGRPMHAGEILEALVADGFTVPGQDPVAALNTRLWKRSGVDGPLRRLGDAVYALAVPGPDGASRGP